MSLEYTIALTDKSQITRARLDLLSHPFAKDVPDEKGIWIIPGTLNGAYLARVFETDRGFLVEFDFYRETGDRLRPWLEQLRQLGGFEILDDDQDFAPANEARFESWLR